MIIFANGIINYLFFNSNLLNHAEKIILSGSLFAITVYDSNGAGNDFEHEW